MWPAKTATTVTPLQTQILRLRKYFKVEQLDFL